MADTSSTPSPPYRHRMISRITMLVLIPMAFFFWAGWLVWAVMLVVTGMRHPAVPVWPELDVPFVASSHGSHSALMVLTIMPAPISESPGEIVVDLYSNSHG